MIISYSKLSFDKDAVLINIIEKIDSNESRGLTTCNSKKETIAAVKAFLVKIEKKCMSVLDSVPMVYCD